MTTATTNHDIHHHYHHHHPITFPPPNHGNVPQKKRGDGRVDKRRCEHTRYAHFFLFFFLCLCNINPYRYTTMRRDGPPRRVSLSACLTPPTPHPSLNCETEGFFANHHPMFATSLAQLRGGGLFFCPPPRSIVTTISHLQPPPPI